MPDKQGLKWSSCFLSFQATRIGPSGFPFRPAALLLYVFYSDTRLCYILSRFFWWSMWTLSSIGSPRNNVQFSSAFRNLPLLSLLHLVRYAPHLPEKAPSRATLILCTSTIPIHIVEGRFPSKASTPMASLPSSPRNKEVGTSLGARDRSC